ncbi:MAG: hypothetical protein KDA60_00065, partial [Planctomycetales bacterium]|nr:hypothetical protein [Planctomycetales bacterium]
MAFKRQIGGRGTTKRKKSARTHKKLSLERLEALAAPGSLLLALPMVADEQPLVVEPEHPARLPLRNSLGNANTDSQDDRTRHRRFLLDDLLSQFETQWARRDTPDSNGFSSSTWTSTKHRSSSQNGSFEQSTATQLHRDSSKGLDALGEGPANSMGSDIPLPSASPHRSQPGSPTGVGGSEVNNEGVTVPVSLPMQPGYLKPNSVTGLANYAVRFDNRGSGPGLTTTSSADEFDSSFGANNDEIRKDSDSQSDGTIADGQGHGDTLSPVASRDDGEWGHIERGIWHDGDASGWQGDYRVHPAGDGTSTAQWSISIEPGQYEIFATWNASDSNATDAPYRVFDGASAGSVIRRNQALAPGGGQFLGRPWESLGVFNITTGVPTVELSDAANGQVIADGVIFVPHVPDNVAPELLVSLANDTAPDRVTNTDGVTSDPSISGEIIDASSIQSFRAGIDTTDASSYVEVLDTLQADGSFLLDEELVAVINGGPLPDGRHTLFLIAEDQHGNVSLPSRLTFTLDTQAPDIALQLADSSDTGQLGDNVTSLDLVALNGISEPNATIEFPDQGLTSRATADGNVSVFGVPLRLGENTIRTFAVDIAGNEQSGESIITREPPEGAIILSETNQFLTEVSIPIELGQDEGNRTLSFQLDADFDTTDGNAAIEDTFLLYLVDSMDRTQTLLDRGERGTAFFSLGGGNADYQPGLVRFDGSVVSIDLTSLGDLSEGTLLAQLINSDTDEQSIVALSRFTNVVDIDGVASPAFLPVTVPVSPGESVDLEALNATESLEVRVENLRVDSTTGEYTAELRVANHGSATGRNVVITLVDLPEGIVVANASGTDALGNPYLNIRPAIPMGGLRQGETSDAVYLQIANPSLSRFTLRTQVQVGGPNMAPQFDVIAPRDLLPGQTLTLPLAATDPDGDEVTYTIQRGEASPPAAISLDSALKIVATPDDAGTHTYTISATDGVLETVRTFVLNVLPDTVQVTRIRGSVLDTNGTPLADVPVEVGRFQSATASDGTFEIRIPSFISPTEALPVHVPVGDVFFDPVSEGDKEIEFFRAGYDLATGDSIQNPRQHPNLVTSFLDASSIYGSDLSRANALRTLDGSGRLKTSAGNLLPINNELTFPGGPLENENNSPNDPNSLFAAGDVRANENVGLQSLHTLLVREHNRRADSLRAENSDWSGDEIYDDARRWVGALLQAITYNEFLPVLLGEGAIPTYAGYDPDVDPAVSGLFSGAAFRFGHSTAVPELQRLDSFGASLPGGALSLREAFFNTTAVQEDGIEPYLRGMASQTLEELDTQVIDELRNFLFGPPGAGGLDLVSLNIQRGRDFGLPSYNQARVDMGLSALNSFAEISSTPSVQSALANVYDSVDDIDVWVGGLAEDHVTGAMVGELFWTIIRDQFIRMRDGDRFWYENAQFDEVELASIRSTTLEDLVARNTSIDSLPEGTFTKAATVPTGPNPGGEAAITTPAARTLDGSDNNLTNPSLGKAGTNLRVDYTLDYADGISQPSGADRPGAREISNTVFATAGGTTNLAQATNLFAVWGQLLTHDTNLTPGGTDSTLKVHGELASANSTYPFIAEKLPLLLEHGVYPLADNAIQRPIYLPALDIAGGAVITPEADVMVTQQLASGGMASVAVAAGTLQTREGNPFDHVLSITEVPVDRTPAALPDGMRPGTVVTIQPGEMIFTEPAPLTLPNTTGFGGGLFVDLWSINPQTGEFEVVGIGRVSDDGQTIETVDGGIRNSSWHFFSWLIGDLEFADDAHNLDQQCNECVADVPTNSSTQLHAGDLIESHSLSTYSSLGVSRGIELVYDSGRIPSSRAFHYNFPTPDDDDEGTTIVAAGNSSIKIEVLVDFEVEKGNSTVAGPRQRTHLIANVRQATLSAITGSGGRPGGLVAQVAAAGPSGTRARRNIAGAFSLDLAKLPTGFYEATISANIRTTSDGMEQTGAPTTQTVAFDLVNARNSAFGAGWGIAGLQQLYYGGVDPTILVNGDGSELFFRPLGGGRFESPPGDFSTLRRLSDGSFQRTMTDRTVYTFDAAGLMRSMTDRNGNQTLYNYSEEGLLTSMVDPVGLETTLRYADGRVSEIEDPTGRITRLAHDDQGNLTQITDPDTTSRTFSYDSAHRMTGEIDKRGLSESTAYENGKVAQTTRRDGTVLNIDSAQARSTRNTNRPIATFTDANGNVTEYTLDKQGQVVSTRDAEGSGSTIVRDGNNLVTQVTDSRRFDTFYEYDSRGNVVAIDDTVVGIDDPRLTFHVPNLGVEASYENVAPGNNVYAIRSHYNEFNGAIYYGMGGPPSQHTLRRINADGTIEQVNSSIQIVNNVSGLDFNPDTGDIYLFSSSLTTLSPDLDARPAGGSFTTIQIGTIVGMDVATADRNAGFLPTGAIVAASFGKSQNFGNRDNIYLFPAPGGYGGSQQRVLDASLHFDDGTLILAVDITITPDAIYVVDTGGGSLPGVIYQVLQDGTLVPVATDEILLDPVAISYDPVTDNLLVLDDATGRLLEIDPDIGSVTTLVSGFSPHASRAANWAGLDITPEGTRIIITEPETDSIFVLARASSGTTRRTFTYDPTFSQLTSITDELGRQTLLDIDPANGNTLAITEVVGQLDSTSGETDDIVTRFTYTTEGLVDTTIDPLGRVTDYDYDLFGRLTAMTFAVGTADEATQQFEYDAAGNTTAIVDENGNRTEFTYDALNRLLSITEADPDGDAGPLSSPVTTFEYDANGNVTRTTDAEGHETFTTYDAMDRVVRIRDEQSNVTRFVYDPNGNLVQTIDPLGQRTRNSYDARNRLVETIDPDGGSTTFRYDRSNNLILLTDPVGNTTRYAYDFRDRVISEIDPLRQTTYYEYDQVDNLVRKTDRNQRVTEFVYDDVDRLLTETWLNADESIANTIQYDYDKASNLRAIDDAFSALEFGYDNRDRVTSVDNAGTPDVPNVVLEYDYDDVGNVLSVTDTIAGSLGGTNEYLYDALNRTVRITQAGPQASEKRVDFTYNDLGQYTAIDRFSDLAGTQPVVTTTYTYDTLNRLVDLRHNNGTEDVAFYQYAYDADSRIASILDVDGLTTYSYDDRDQLTGADRGASDPRGDESYTYDANGNRVESHLHGAAYVTGDANRLLSDGTYNYAYDDEGNMVLRTEIATGYYREFEYDHRNRLFRVTDFSSGGIITQEVTYTYDALDRRIARTADTDGEGGESPTIEHYVYEGNNVLLDFVDSDGAGTSE